MTCHVTYFPELLERRRVTQKALRAVIQEDYVQNISTRSISTRSVVGLVETLGMRGVHKSHVGWLRAKFDLNQHPLSREAATSSFMHLRGVHECISLSIALLAMSSCAAAILYAP